MASNEIVKRLTAARGRLRDQFLVDVHSAMSLQLAAQRSGGHLVGLRSSRLYSRGIFAGAPAGPCTSKSPHRMTTYTRTLSAIAAAALVVAATVSTVAGQPPSGSGRGRALGEADPAGRFQSSAS